MDCFKTKEGNSIVRVFHASPNAPTVDVYVDDEILAPGLAYTDISDYSYMEEGMHTIEIRSMRDSTTTILTKMIDVPDDRIFTIAIVGNLDNLEFILIEDDIDEIPSPKESTVRVVHLSPDSPNVNVFANGNSLFENLNFKGNSDYNKVPSGAYSMDITSSNTGDIVLSGNLNLKANRIYTIYVIGNPPSLGLIQSVDVNSYLCR